MSHGPEHQIEHAEHAAHASHDTFNRQVTISIAIIAAVLAFVTMLGHRAHNDTLKLQAESGKMTTEASNTWARYQAANGRFHQYKSQLELSDMLPTRTDNQTRQDEVRKRWQGQVDKYENDQLPKLKKEAEEQMEESQRFKAESEEMHGRGDRFDLGELFLQMGVVLASLAILTKMALFWYGGIVSALVGAALAATGYFGILMGHH